MLKIVLLCYIILGCIPVNEGYSSGPPSWACPSMMPSHGANPQSTPSPYTITASSNTYQRDQTINVTITATNQAQPFKGFFVQARKFDTTNAIGRFSTRDSDVKLITCDPAAYSNNAVSHNHLSQPQTIKQFTWDNPAGGDVYFQATFVQKKTQFWNDVQSATITETQPTTKQETTTQRQPDTTTTRADTTTTRADTTTTRADTTTMRADTTTTRADTTTTRADTTTMRADTTTTRADTTTTRADTTTMRADTTTMRTDTTTTRADTTTTRADTTTMRADTTTTRADTTTTRADTTTMRADTTTTRADTTTTRADTTTMRADTTTMRTDTTTMRADTTAMRAGTTIMRAETTTTQTGTNQDITTSDGLIPHTTVSAASITVFSAWILTALVILIQIN